MRREFYLLLVVDFFDITKNAQINFANYNLAKFFFFIDILLRRADSRRPSAKKTTLSKNANQYFYQRQFYS